MHARVLQEKTGGSCQIIRAQFPIMFLFATHVATAEKI
jgi:hypothetical protein